MKLTIGVAMAAMACAGCLSSRPPEATNWTVEPSAAEIIPSANSKFGTVRLAHFWVRAPYDGKSLVVERPDGSLAFDAYNRFAASPATLLQGPAQDVMMKSGLFSAVITSAPVPVEGTFEVTVTRLALDCREENRRDAAVEVMIVHFANHAVKATVHGTGVVPAADGAYTRAFSSAFTAALVDALRKL